ncbi:O-antigen ligase family protein [Litchfieldella rifensis]|uniref:O-antigen ligase family protein n=1 Tax=Litchfieldella rifensis TaxID=762643 RepID=A0ABV7LU17_9GAMM
MTSLAVYGSLRLLWPEVGELGGTLMGFLGLGCVLACGKRLRSSPALWLLLAAVVIQLITWTLGYWHHPEWMTDNPQLDRMAKWFLFIGVAWWLGGSTRATLALWGVALLGLLLTTLLTGGGIDQWLAGLQGERVDFGLQNSQHTSMFFGTALVGVLAFSRRLLAAGRWAMARRIAWLVALAMCVCGVVITQTRAVWLALALVLPVMAVVGLLWSYSRQHKERAGKLSVALLLGGVAVLFLAGVAFQGAIERRLDDENQIIAALLDGDIEAVPFESSIGNRVHTWIAAAQWIQERPLVGWGENGRSLAVQETDWLPEYTRDRYSHLHNTFLEVFVSYGLMGVALLAALAWWIGHGTWRAWRSGVLPGDMALFASGFFIYWVVVNQFEAYLSFWSGVYVHNLIVGGLVTHIWRWQWEQGQRELTRVG